MSVNFSETEEIFPPGEEPQDSEKMPGCVEESVESVGGAAVCEALQAQAGVADQSQDTVELEDVQMEECKVDPIGREELPLSEEEQKLREELDGKSTQVELSLEESMTKDVQERAKELLEAWSSLQEMFKIPKKERQAERRKHESEADRGSYHRDHRDRDDFRYHQDHPPYHHQQQQHHRRLSSNTQLPRYQSYQEPREKYNDNSRDFRENYTANPRINRKGLRLDDRTGRLCKSNLNREDRRMLFQAKVEEEKRQKMLRQAITANHNQCCQLLNLQSNVTPMLPKYPEFYFSGGKWVPMPPAPLPIDPSWTPPLMAALPPEAFRPDDPPLPNPRSVYPPGCCPDPPQENVIIMEQSETVADICAYYDKARPI